MKYQILIKLNLLIFGTLFYQNLKYFFPKLNLIQNYKNNSLKRYQEKPLQYPLYIFVQFLYLYHFLMQNFLMIFFTLEALTKNSKRADFKLI